MLNLSMVSTLLGAAVGLRFGVLALVPVMALELGIVAVNAITIGESVGRLAIVVSLVATSAQLGYLGGSVLGFLSDHGASMLAAAGMSGSAKKR